MRVLVISDIHGNLKAFETVLAHAGKTDAVWCLGDTVGYGPQPNECVELVQKLPNLVCLKGNHDAASIGEMSMASFNREARQAVEWTQSVLTEENAEFLRNLPKTHTSGKVTLAHGSPRQPTYEYLLDTRTASENFEYFETDFCFVGHTHLPLIFTAASDDYQCAMSFPIAGETIILKPRTIINPGSIGQPRDRDARSAYAIYNTELHTWNFQRTSYDISATQEAMRTQNLPERHIIRLAGGW